jgi:hypothetical protein
MKLSARQVFWDVPSCQLVVSPTFRRISKKTSSVSSPRILVSPYWLVNNFWRFGRSFCLHWPAWPCDMHITILPKRRYQLPVNMMIYPGYIAMRNPKLQIILPCNPLLIYLQEQTLDKLWNYQLMKKNYTPWSWFMCKALKANVTQGLPFPCFSISWVDNWNGLFEQRIRYSQGLSLQRASNTHIRRRYRIQQRLK